MKIMLSSIMGMGVHDGHEGTMRCHGAVGLWDSNIRLGWSISITQCPVFLYLLQMEDTKFHDTLDTFWPLLDTPGPSQISTMILDPHTPSGFLLQPPTSSFFESVKTPLDYLRFSWSTWTLKNYPGTSWILQQPLLPSQSLLTILDLVRTTQSLKEHPKAILTTW